MGLFARKFSPSPDLPEVLPGLARQLFPALSPIEETCLGSFRPSSEEMFAAEREENAQPAQSQDRLHLSHSVHVEQVIRWNEF